MMMTSVCFQGVSLVSSLSMSQGWKLFSGGKFPEVSVRTDCRCDLFSLQTLSELKFFASDRHCFSGRNET